MITHKPTPPLKRKPLGIPLAVARVFVRDMHRYHDEPNPIRRDEIASGTLRMMREHYREGLGLTDVKRMFDRLRNELE